jgi:hypothetical protein
MMESPMENYIAGLITMGYLVAGLFFLRFWRRTHDGLFMVFAIAFWLLTANSALVVLGGIPREEHSWIYLLRLAAFVLIIIAIVRKNMRGSPRRD